MRIKFYFLFLLILYCYAPKNQKEKPKNIILMIGDGMGIAHITAGIYSSPTPLNFTRFKQIGLMTTHSYDNIVTDSAASGTAIATGEKTYNKAISVNLEKIRLKTILEIAKEKGFSIGVVVTNSITDATPAAFLAHSENRENHYEIAEDIVNLEPDIILGGGRDYFINRPDEQNLLDKLKDKNYEVYFDFSEFQKLNVLNFNKKIAGFFADKNLPPVKKINPNPNLKYYDYLIKNTNFNQTRNSEYLSLATKKAIEYLQQLKKPFFLVIEGSQIDYGGHNMDGDYVIGELLDFDKTIGVVLDFAEKSKEDTLVIATSDHETGGLAIVGGDLKKNQVELKFIYEKHSASLVPVFSYGIGSEEFSGIFDNTDIFKKIKNLIQ